MSEVKRYSLTLHKVKGKFKSPEFERDNGEWVKFDDYARLKAEVERLRKAGDAMADKASLAGCSECFGMYNDLEKSLDDWTAAKEGKPSA